MLKKGLTILRVESKKSSIEPWLKEMELFFKKMQLVKCHLLKTSSDEDVKMLYEAGERPEKGRYMQPSQAKPSDKRALSANS